MKEAIKMQVEFSLLYKTLLMVEMRSKIFKDKGRRSTSFENCWHPFYDQGYRQYRIVFDVFLISISITLEF